MEGGGLGHIQDPSSHQLPGEPVQALMEAYPTAGIAALDVPAPPAAQLMETQELRHFLHRHHPWHILPAKQEDLFSKPASPHGQLACSL